MSTRLNKHQGHSARRSLFAKLRKQSTRRSSAGVSFEALDPRRLYSASAWTAEPVALPYYFDHTPTQITVTKTHTAAKAASTSVTEDTYAGSSTAYGLTPTQVDDAYGINNINFNGTTGNGAGETIAIVDAYDDPNALSDANAFSNYFGLPDFNAGGSSPTFTKLSQTGSTTSLPGTDPSGPYSSTGGSDWEQEESLDIEWAHAVAPDANIDLIEASNANSLFTAVAEARSLTNVTVVSMSWGGSEFSSETSYDSTYFTTPSGHSGITFVASAGDQGAYGGGGGAIGVEYPAASPNVLSVGGTALTVSGDTYVSESAWGNGTSSYSSGGGGGGISEYEAQPSYQSGIVTQSTTKRTVPDVSMLADPNTGVPVYDSYDFGTSTPWIPGYEGGTSLAAPMWAGLVAIADQGRSLSGLTSLNGSTQTLPSLYKLPSTDFHDITSGSNGYSAATGYDLVTGLGSPVANLLVPALAGVTSSGGGTTTPVAPTVSVLSASSITVTSGASFTLNATATDPNAGGSIKSVSFYRESNGTSGLQTSGDTLVGTVTSSTNGTWSESVTTTGLSAGSYTFYAVATDNSGLTSNSASIAVTVTAPVTTPANSAVYVRTDSTTLGNWKGVYGTQGEYVPGDSLTDPSYATLTTNGYVYEWASNSSSSQYVNRASSGRIGSMLYAAGTLQIGIDLTDGKTHQVAFYIADQNIYQAQSEVVAAYDGKTGALLSTQTINASTGGKYAVFKVSGNVVFKVTAVGGSYGTVNGFFIDPTT
ncbi:MAG TPA: hypothetical protein VGG19_14485 [Tepidisphaeraceae bacterium]